MGYPAGFTGDKKAQPGSDQLRPALVYNCLARISLLPAVFELSYSAGEGNSRIP